MAELKMLRFSLAVTIVDKIRHECIAAHNILWGGCRETTREARMRWFVTLDM